MTDRELSALLKEWTPTAAPGTLRDRVFPPVQARPWWDYIPATPVAAFGALAGVLIVWSLARLAPREEPKSVAPPVQETVAPPTPMVTTPASQTKLKTKARPQVKQPEAKTAAPQQDETSRLASGPTIETPLLNVVAVLPAGVEPELVVTVVRLRVLMTADGRLVDVFVMSPASPLDDIAIEAVKERFNGRQVAAAAPTLRDVEVTFRSRPRGKAVAR